MLYQKTIKESIKIEGVGLHSGEKVSMELCPAPPDTGVVFRRDGVSIKALRENVAGTSYATSLVRAGVHVRTVEHLLSALAGLAVDNLYVEMEGGEVPIIDGSAWPFVKAIIEAGTISHGAARRFLKVVRPITVTEGDKSATLLPSPIPRITYRIDFDHPLLRNQRYSLDIDTRSFVEELARARTFGFLKDAEMLTKAGLARGGSSDNAIILTDDGIVNQDGLRYPDEFVRHKMMDAIGDLSLIGMPVIGHLIADKSGHRLNQRLVQETLLRQDSWIVVEGGLVPEDAASQGLVFSEAVPG